MVKSVFSTRAVLIMGTSLFAILAAGQGEAMAQAGGVCALATVARQTITAGCSFQTTHTYISTLGSPVYTINITNPTTGITIDPGVTLTPSDPTNGGYLFENQISNFFVINNKGILNGTGNAPVIYNNVVSTTNIVNSGIIRTSNSGAPNFLLTSFGSDVPAIEIGKSSGFTLNNQANAQIIGGTYAIYSFHNQINAPFRVNNSGTIDAQGSNSYGIFFFSTQTPGTNSFITNENGGTIKGTIHGIYLQNNASRSYSNFTITNKGSIVGTSGFGINLDMNTNNATITNFGTISGGTSAILFGGGGNTLNIHDGAVFTNGVDFNNRTGNTLNFYTGSYTLGVKRYSLASNTINLLGAGNQLITTDVVNGGGTGNIVVVAPQVAATPAATTTTVAASLANVISSVSNLASTVSSPSTIVPPVQGVTPEVPPPGREAGGFGQDFTAYDPVSPNPVATRTNMQTYSMANLSEFSATDLLRSKQGQKVDARGNLAWGRAFGSYRALPSAARVIGNSTAMGGVMFGYDRNLADWRLGIYAGYSYGYTRMNDASGNVKTDYYMGGVYARRDFGAYTLLANLSGGVMANRMNRSINLGAEQAKSSFTGFFLTPELALSRDVALAPGWTVTPTLRVRYVGSFLPTYRESGSSQNIAYGSSTSHGFEERAELKLTRSMKTDAGLTSSYYVQAAAIGTHRVGGDSLNVPASWAAHSRSATRTSGIRRVHPSVLGLTTS